MNDAKKITAANQTACGSELNSSMECETQRMEEAGAILPYFIGAAQLAVLQEGFSGEEHAFFTEKVLELGELFETMPKTYEQDGLGDEAVAHLHYFMGGMDWFITEKDMNEEQLQAFGLCDLGMGFPEIGYVSLPEILANGAELDLCWTPKTLATIKKGRSSPSGT